jgi:hypothetical protein
VSNYSFVADDHGDGRRLSGGNRRLSGGNRVLLQSYREIKAFGFQRFGFGLCGSIDVPEQAKFTFDGCNDYAEQEFVQAFTLAGVDPPLSQVRPIGDRGPLPLWVVTAGFINSKGHITPAKGVWPGGSQRYDYAVVAGGQPETFTVGGCVNDGMQFAPLQVLTRRTDENTEALVHFALNEIRQLGFDPNALEDVGQPADQCNMFFAELENLCTPVPPVENFDNVKFAGVWLAQMSTEAAGPSFSEGDTCFLSDYEFELSRINLRSYRRIKDFGFQRFGFGLCGDDGDDGTFTLNGCTTDEEKKIQTFLPLTPGDSPEPLDQQPATNRVFGTTPPIDFRVLAAGCMNEKGDIVRAAKATCSHGYDYAIVAGGPPLTFTEKGCVVDGTEISPAQVTLPGESGNPVPFQFLARKQDKNTEKLVHFMKEEALDLGLSVAGLFDVVQDAATCGEFYNSLITPETADLCTGFTLAEGCPKLP